MKIELRFPALLLLNCALAISTVGCTTTRPPALRPFTSDGCTAIPDGPANDPDKWQAPCRAHDLSYWQGGTFRERLEADRELRDAVRDEGDPVAAAIIFAGVRMGGSPLWPTPWRWGFGWKDYPRGYRPLTAEEQILVESEAPESQSPPD